MVFYIRASDIEIRRINQDIICMSQVQKITVPFNIVQKVTLLIHAEPMDQDITYIIYRVFHFLHIYVQLKKMSLNLLSSFVHLYTLNTVHYYKTLVSLLKCLANLSVFLLYLLQNRKYGVFTILERIF